MIPQQTAESPAARHYDYDDREVVAADFGPGVDPTVDIVDGTVIVIAGDDQHEFPLPEGAVETFTRNGVVTIEVRA